MPDTALIWGVSGGIGSELAHVLADAGWRVLGVARNPQRLSDHNALAYTADLARDADVAAAALWAAQEAGSVNLWVYAAGDILAQALADTSAAAWARIIDANLTGAHLALHHSLPLVTAGGHVMFIGAYVDRVALPKLGAYAAAKAGLEAYVQVLRKELRDRRVTLVRARAVATPLWKKVPFRPPRQEQLSPREVAEALVRAYNEGHTGTLDL